MVSESGFSNVSRDKTGSCAGWRGQVTLEWELENIIVAVAEDD